VGLAVTDAGTPHLARLGVANSAHVSGRNGKRSIG
jgi:hypothetical protein